MCDTILKMKKSISSLKTLKKGVSILNGVLEQDKYISNSEWEEAINTVGRSLPVSFMEYIKIFLYPISLIAYIKLKKRIKRKEYIRHHHNDSFVELELERKSEFFDGIEKYGLDEQQRRAVIANEDNALVIAGAGSGKTTTIVGKIKYLVEHLEIESTSILPISFTRKSAKSLEDRINVSGIHPQTFHKFGLTALQSVEHRKPAIFDEANSKNLFRTMLEDLSKNEEYLVTLTEFFVNYIKIPKSQFDFETHGDYIQYLKDQNFTTYKRVKIPHRGKETYRNETVKSIEECMIANFLTFNRVDYAYEKPYEFPFSQLGRKKSYKPDFTLGKDVYLEHFGIDKDGNVPPFFAGPNETHSEATRRYNKSIEWKRKTHNQNETTLIESYSYQFMDGTLINNLKKNLVDTGIIIKPMTNKEIWEVIKNSGKDEVDGFISLCQTFLSLLKSNDIHVDSLSLKITESDDNEFMKNRALEFINLFIPIYEKYEEYLKDNKLIDFNDMISRATEYIKRGDYHCPIKYVIIDEFQDISIGRYKMLQSIKKQNPDVKFYCVGDDWQSIFRFAGSDISLFKNYEDYFGYTFKAHIETTYRFNDPLISLSTNFILKNPNQEPKSLRAPDGALPTEHTIIESEGFENDDTDALVQAIEKLVDAGFQPGNSVYLIGRYNFDLKRIMNRGREFVISYSGDRIKYTFPKGPLKGKELNIQFVTAHRAKGLEADYVIVINCNSGKYGFPSGKADDPILNLLLVSADQFENGEERRLFYVAMTRTKKHVIFITDRYKKSKFIKEIQDGEGGRENSCPKCQKGELILRSAGVNGRWFKFYGCSNFSYGCKYTKSYKPEDKPAIKHTSSLPPKKDTYKQPVSTGRNSLNTKSKLTKSEQNRLEFFLKTPKKYTGSAKAIDKVKYLEQISHKFTAQQKVHFNTAMKTWEKYLPK